MSKIITPILRDTIELCDASGAVVETVSYSVNVLKAFEAIAAAQAEFNAALEADDTERIGRAVVGMMAALFGQEATERIVNFYGAETPEEANNLVWLVTPIIVDTVFPALEKQHEQIIASRKALSRYGAHV